MTSNYILTLLNKWIHNGYIGPVIAFLIFASLYFYSFDIIFPKKEIFKAFLKAGKKEQMELISALLFGLSIAYLFFCMALDLEFPILIQFFAVKIIAFLEKIKILK